MKDRWPNEQYRSENQRVAIELVLSFVRPIGNWALERLGDVIAWRRTWRKSLHIHH